MRVRAHFDIVDDRPGKPLVIRDLGGPHMSVTNDAEAVCQYLHELGHLQDGRRLFYYDSQEPPELDELVHDNGTFLRFAPGPRPVRR